MEYLDFELEISSGVGQDYPIALIQSPAGEAHETMHFPFDKLALENQLLSLQNALLRSGGSYRQMLSPEEQTIRQFGQALFGALFQGDVRRYYEVSQHEALHQGKGL